MAVNDVLGTGFDDAPLSIQRGASLYDFEGRHKIRISKFAPLSQKPGFSVDAELVASTSSGLRPGAHVGFPMVKSPTPAYAVYFQSMVKRVIGAAFGQPPEKIKGQHVAAAADPIKAPLKGKIIVIETTAPNAKGKRNINILGGDEVQVTQAAYDPSAAPSSTAPAASEAVSDADEPDFNFS